MNCPKTAQFSGSVRSRKWFDAHNPALGPQIKGASRMRGVNCKSPLAGATFYLVASKSEPAGPKLVSLREVLRFTENAAADGKI